MNFFSCFLTFLVIQDPIGNIPICFSLLKQVPSERRVWLILRENVIALSISSMFLLSGNALLDYLHITPYGLGIAGGFILFIVALNMIFPSNQQDAQQKIQEPFIVPLAIPMLAGPSMMARVTLYAAQYPHELALCFLPLCTVTVLSTIILLLAIPLQKWCKPQILEAIERLMGVILITLATQMILDNFKTYITLTISEKL